MQYYIIRLIEPDQTTLDGMYELSFYDKSGPLFSTFKNATRYQDEGAAVSDATRLRENGWHVKVQHAKVEFTDV